MIALPITEASAKVRTGGPVDDDEDLTVPVWAGHLPLALHAAVDEAAERFERPGLGLTW